MKETKKFELGPLQKEWIKILREHPERQLTGTLGRKNRTTGEINVCCLGQAGLITGVCKWDENNESEDQDVLKSWGKNGVGKDDFSIDTLAWGTFDSIGLKDANGYNETRHLNGEKVCTLSGLNDTGWTWPQIADELEKNPEQWFKESK